MNIRGYSVLVYGFLLIVGGLIGYFKADSMPSLLGGSISGVLAVACAVSILRNQPAGSLFALILSVMLAFFFGYRFYLTQGFMPSGLMAILSVAVVLVLTFAKKHSNSLAKNR